MPAFLKSDYYGQFDTRLLAEDLARLLNKATNRKFNPVPDTGGLVNGIFLMLDSSRQYSSNESGIIESDAKSFLRIKARYTTGISYTMYSWLDDLGFRFYLPGDEWTIIPSLKSIFRKKISNKTYSPFFPMRLFFASGGMYAVKGLDDDKKNTRDWHQWYQRNRMGYEDLRIDGHIGELFNIVHQKEIEKDTSLIAPINGKRQYNTNAKLDPTNKKGVDLFSDWVVSEFQKEQAGFPSFLPYKKYATADAGDGYNYCHTPACETTFKSVSDQSFSIINETAKKIKIVNPKAGVSTLAYTERADTPSLKIESNVHVMVVSSAFQSVTTASELMLRWAKKTKNISQYEYLNIGVWAYDKPFFNMYQYHNRLQFLKSLNIKGIRFETSWSKFSSGIQQYFILRYLCNPYESMEAMLDEFCNVNFGSAAPPIKKLLQEWYFSNVHLYTYYDKPSFYEDELGRFVQYLLTAENTPGISAAVHKRIEELKAYTIYLCKFYEMFAELKSLAAYSANPALGNEKAEELLTYTWKLYNTKIFHNTQLNDLLKAYTSSTEREKWNYHNSDHFKDIAENTSAVISREFELIKRKYLPLAVAQHPITDSFFISNVKYSADSIRFTTMDETALPNFVYPVSFFCNGPGNLRIICEADSSKLKNKSGKIAMISVESADYKFIKTDYIFQQMSSAEFNYQLPKRGHYTLYLSQFNATHVKYRIFPRNNLFYHNKKSIMMNGLIMQDNAATNGYQNKRIAFYTPPADSIYFSNLYFDATNTNRLYSASGIKITVKENKMSYYNAATMPAEPGNNFIFYENSVYRWPLVLKNAAPCFFFLKYDTKD